jgi:hypothetical protein
MKFIGPAFYRSFIEVEDFKREFIFFIYVFLTLPFMFYNLSWEFVRFDIELFDSECFIPIV